MSLTMLKLKNVVSCNNTIMNYCNNTIMYQLLVLVLVIVLVYGNILLYYVITDRALCIDILCIVQQCTIYVTLYLL